MGLFNKSAQLLPVKVSKNEERLVPTSSDPQMLSQKRKELSDLVRKAAEDGEITKIEYDELCELTVQVGVNNFELNEMIRAEYKKALKDKVQLFVEDDGKVDETEIKNLMCLAKEIGVGEAELKTLISESLSKYKLEQQKIREERKKINKAKAKEITTNVAEKTKVITTNVAEKANKLGKLLLVAGAFATVAYVGLKAQKQQVNNIAAKQGNYKVSITTVMHKSAKNQ